MKKVFKVFLIIVIVIVVLIGLLVVQLIRNAKKQEIEQALMVKTDEELIGEHFYMPRSGKEDVDLNLYMIDDGEKHPVVFNIHGGAFIAGDADTLDTQSDRISREWKVNVVTVNYQLAKNGIPISYAVDEVIDTVKYFIDHAEEYKIDKDNVFVMGYSAGGYHTMAAVLELKKQNINVTGQIICYGFIKEVVETYNSFTEEQKATVAPALFVLADHDPISDGSLKYEEALRLGGVSTKVKKYEGAKHGFIEENNPEYEKLHDVASKSPEQEIIARKAENDIKEWLNENLI